MTAAGRVGAAARQCSPPVEPHQNKFDPPVERFFLLAVVSCFVRRKQDVRRSRWLGLLPGLRPDIFNVLCVNSLRFGTKSGIANRRPKNTRLNGVVVDLVPGGSAAAKPRLSIIGRSARRFLSTPPWASSCSPGSDRNLKSQA